ncbi:MAG: toll/interleukin-1 receptor domain-containing protein [Anaerolineae bacterium]
MQNIFISYGRRDASDIAETLSNRLRALKYGVFRDKDSIVGSQQWRDALTRNILNSNLMVVLVTDASNDSDYVYQEIVAAEENEKPILPVRINGTKLPVYLRKWQAIEFQDNNYGDVILEIKRALEEFESAPTKSRNTFPFRLVASLASVIVIIALSWLVYSTGIFSVANPTEIPLHNTPSPAPSNTPPPTKTNAPTATEPALPTSQLTPISNGSRVFEDFEDIQLPADWQISGDWRFINTDGNFALNLNSGIGEITFGSEKWVDYELMFKVLTRDVSNAKALYVYMRDTGARKLAVTLDLAQKKIMFIQLTPNTSQVLYSLDFPFKSDYPLVFDIRVSGGQVSFRINNIPFPQRIFIEDIESGAITFRTLDTTLLLDDIQVDLLSIKQ